MQSKWQHLVREKNFSSLFANMSIAGLGLLSFMLLTRQLDQAAFGQWVLFIALA
jgi:O-antigen/teichoic acid export membrane protein